MRAYASRCGKAKSRMREEGRVPPLIVLRAEVPQPQVARRRTCFLPLGTARNQGISAFRPLHTSMSAKSPCGIRRLDDGMSEATGVTAGGRAATNGGRKPNAAGMSTLEPSRRSAAPHPLPLLCSRSPKSIQLGLNQEIVRASTDASSATEQKIRARRLAPRPGKHTQHRMDKRVALHHSEKDPLQPLKSARGQVVTGTQLACRRLSALLVGGELRR
jgi:hypothetical protein